tara:strand:+ start:3975 stop:4796 length:822 start_codon:yes stop_codon:yes gene_type:complete
MKNKVKDLFNLEKKTIIIAGGAGQIGFSMCEAILSYGARVIVIDLDIENAKNKAQLLSKKYRENLFYYKLDISKYQDVELLFNKISKEFKTIDGLVNCFHYKGNPRKLDYSENFFNSLENFPIDVWDKVHDVNLKGTFLACREFSKIIDCKKGGVIVNISSTYGNVSPNKNIYKGTNLNSPIAYASSKSAIINLSRYLAVYLSDKNIRVNTLSPGGVYNNQEKEFIKNYEKLTPMGRMAHPEDYQGSIIFLLSDASSYMTGSNLIVDGGWTAW